VIKTFEQSVLDFYFTATNPANNVVMVIARDLIGPVAAAGLRWTRKPVSCQEFQRTINRRFCEARKVLFGLSVDFGRGKMCPGMMENVQDRHPLGRHSESA